MHIADKQTNSTSMSSQYFLFQFGTGRETQAFSFVVLQSIKQSKTIKGKGLFSLGHINIFSNKTTVTSAFS